MRAFNEHETLRCWWPPESGDAMFFEGVPAGETVQHPARSVRRNVTSHTDARSSEFGAALSGALLGLAILLIVVSSSL